MTCQTCGADLPPDARFCPQCATPIPEGQGTSEDAPTEVLSAGQAEADVVAEETAAPEDDLPEIDGAPAGAPEDIDMPPIDPADPVPVPPTEPVEEPEDAPADSPALPPNDTATGITSPALQRVIETPPRPRRERRPLEERGTWEEFLAAIVPLVREPRFSGNLLAALGAFLATFLAATIAWLLLDGAFDDNAGLLLPGFVDTDEDTFGVIALLGLVFHQVPMVSGDDFQHLAPLLLALIPLAACVLGLTFARRTMPCSGNVDGFLMRTLPFALIYGALLLVWSLFGAQDWHAAHLRSFLAGVVFAYAAAWIVERFVQSRAATPAPEATTHAAPRGRFAQAARTASRVFVLMVLAGSLAWLVGSIVAFHEDGSAVALSVLQVLEGGFEAIAFGVQAEGYPINDADNGVRVFELDRVVSDTAAVIYIVASLLVVIVGGLFSGFAVARAVQPRSRNDHALFGAVTGLVWAVAMLLAHFLVLSRLEFDDDTYTTFDGAELVLLSLLVGALLGALGGLLASHSHASPRDEEPRTDVVAT